MHLPSIGIYVPLWLRVADFSDWIFFDQLVSSIRESGRYRPLAFSAPGLMLRSQEDARDFCKKNTIAAILIHDSPRYRNNKRYAENVAHLEAAVPCFNSDQVNALACDKNETKKILRKNNIPTLPDSIVDSVAGLEAAMDAGEWYVIKPLDLGAGQGVKLMQRSKGAFFAHSNGKWEEVEITQEVGLRPALHIRYPARGNLRAMLETFIEEKNFSYSSIMVEPFFNDSLSVFSSLRCTVIGDSVVEAVTRINARNITSNVSNGGKARRVLLTPAQMQIAVAAKNAVGAEYAGVDLLTRGGETVVGEVNTGPFTVFGLRTGVRVGALLGEYLIKKCDSLMLQ